MSNNNRHNVGHKSKGGERKSLLIDYIDKQVNVITSDGRNIIGLMRGFDQVCNAILEQCIERVFAKDRGVQKIPLGLYVIRGDNIAVIGDLDHERDKLIDWSTVKASNS